MECLILVFFHAGYLTSSNKSIINDLHAFSCFLLINR